MWHEVGRLDELDDLSSKIVKIGAREVGIVRHGADVFALRNVCPHQSVASPPLCRGAVRTSVGPVPKLGQELAAEDGGRPVIACPWHQWDFDLRTGRCLVDARWRVKAYPVRIEGGAILVEVQ